MRRVDLGEIEDQGWCPAWLRDAMTGYLQVVIEQTQVYRSAAPAVAALLNATKSHKVLDLASGAGGPWPRLLQQIQAAGAAPDVTLSDLRPNRAAAIRFEAEEGFHYLMHRVSALNVPEALDGVRTMFSALHHFSRAEVRVILMAAQRQGIGFAGFEATHRSVRGLLVTAFIPLLVLLMMPRVRPRRWGTLLLTYLPPIVPLLIWWDGVASTLRSHSALELRTLVGEMPEPGYSWSVAEVSIAGAPLPVLQVIGRPERVAQTDDGGRQPPSSANAAGWTAGATSRSSQS